MTCMLTLLARRMDRMAMRNDDIKVTFGGVVLLSLPLGFEDQCDVPRQHQRLCPQSLDFLAFWQMDSPRYEHGHKGILSLSDHLYCCLSWETPALQFF